MTVTLPDAPFDAPVFSNILPLDLLLADDCNVTLPLSPILLTPLERDREPPAAATAPPPLITTDPPSPFSPEPAMRFSAPPVAEVPARTLTAPPLLVADMPSPPPAEIVTSPPLPG